MILEIISILAGIAAFGSITNVFMQNKNISRTKEDSIKPKMVGNLPVITLTNNTAALNFIIDTGSNISHICPSVLDLINTEDINNTKDTVTGLGSKKEGHSICKAKFKDTLSNEYNINLYISSALETTAKSIKDSTGMDIHGILGTDFLKKYNYSIDFKSMVIYIRK